MNQTGRSQRVFRKGCADLKGLRPAGYPQPLCQKNYGSIYYYGCSLAWRRQFNHRAKIRHKGWQVSKSLGLRGDME